MTLLEARGLAKAFGGVRAVDGVDLAVEPGALVALIGPNGAGKTTLFNLLTGQLRPDAGRVHLLGQDVTGWPQHRIAALGAGRTFQIARAFGSFTVRQNVQTALFAAGGTVPTPLARAATRRALDADAVLARIGLADLADWPCASLAYGDLKRIDLALALARGPRLLLMDEPTAGMAPAERAALMDLVAGIVRRDGLGVLFTEHDMDVVFGHADRVLVMARGRLIAAGTPAEVRRSPEVQAVYLGLDTAA